MISKCRELCVNFARDEDGIALTEYLILLGLLTVAVIIAVLAVGTELGNAWARWEVWFRDELPKPPSSSA